MLKQLEIDNFKAFNNFSIELTPFTAIIGDNAACKTSILQAISFLKYSCLSHTDNFLISRGLTVTDIASKFSKRRTMTFGVKFQFDDQIVDWKVVFLLDKTQNTITLNSETVHICDKIFLHYDKDGTSYRVTSNGEKNSVMDAQFDHSIIKLIDIEKDFEVYPILVRIKQFFMNTEDLDLLSPAAMRKSSQGESFEVGLSGEKLSSFVITLPQDKRDSLANDINSFVGSFRKVNSKTKQYGWVHLETTEQYNNHTIEVPSVNISDGTLRNIAFCALKYVNHEHGVILLDEIEDGINNNNLQKLIALLKGIQKLHKIQIIATTHSTVLLDDWCEDHSNPEESSIQVLLRDGNGMPTAHSFFNNDEIKELLNYQYPGEIVLNSSNVEFDNYFRRKNKSK